MWKVVMYLKNVIFFNCMLECMIIQHEDRIDSGGCIWYLIALDERHGLSSRAAVIVVHGRKFSNIKTRLLRNFLPRTTTKSGDFQYIFRSVYDVPIVKTELTRIRLVCPIETKHLHLNKHVYVSWP